MLIPQPFESYLATTLYLLFIFIIYKGVFQYTLLQKSKTNSIKSLVPLGTIGLILGIIGYIRGYMITFEAIEAAGDISPEIVASSFGHSGTYPILGLLLLATSFLFKYMNQPRN